ncbi:MAG: hypothetical protein K9G70_01460 [Prolixibacteraceae bacterium]|nr:hypothetical protein [Prolixibacteraceae bacterium]
MLIKKTNKKGIFQANKYGIPQGFNVNYFFTVLVLIFVFSSCSKPIHDVPFETVKQSYIGGGGYITGLVQDPKNSHIIYARCDVAGMFKSVDSGKSWTLINKGLKKAHNHNVESIAIHPEKTEILLRGSGELRNNQVFGDIYKSIDGGESWYEVCNAIDYFGNGPNRQYGERIAFHPRKPEIVIAGGYKNGVFRSDDEGETWSYVGLKGEPISCVAFHPVTGKCYVATLSEVKHSDILFPEMKAKRPKVGRLFVSSDNGLSWKLIFERVDFEFAELVFTKEDESLIFAACEKSGIYVSKDGGIHFDKSMKGLPEGLPYNTIAIEPQNNSRLYTAPKRKSYNTDVPLVPIYFSDNSGKNWQLLKKYQFNDFSKYPSYIKNEEYIGWSISRIMVDYNDSSRLYMSNWYGVSVSEDKGNTWCGNNFAGTETVCCENMVSDPLKANSVYFTLPDHRPFVSEDGGKTYTQYKEDSRYKNSTVILASKHQPKLLLIGAKDDWEGMLGSAIIRSEDDGKTFSVVKEFENGLTVQSIKEDPLKAGRFYAYIDRKLIDGAGIYYSNDYGINWQRMNMNLPGKIDQLPQKQLLVENEILSIVWGQQKNVCGTNQLLCVDPFRENTIYMGEWTEGIFCTRDFGKTWTNISKGLPFSSDSTALLVDIKVDSNREGFIYAGFLKNGMWRSINYGQSWEKIFPLNNEIFNASSIVVGGYNENELFVASEPLYWAPSESKIFYSSDKGETWKSIYHNEFGALRWKAITVDNFNGNLYGATAGNGVFYFNRINN